MAHFDPKCETRVETDASRKKGFGFALLQNQESTWKLVAAVSRYLKDVETRYAMIELEALAIHYAVKQCHMYLSGLSHFDVITDHQPLKTIFNKKDLYEVDNVKLMKIKQELQSKYVFTVQYRKGIHHGVPDALSRSSVNDPEQEADVGMEFGQISAITHGLGIKDISLENVKRECKEDARYQALYQAILSGFEEFSTKYGSWTKHPKNQYILEFKPQWKNLSVDDGLIILKNKILIPESCRSTILRILHHRHQGVTRTLQNARQSVYWHGITQDVEGLCSSCTECQRLRPTCQKETLQADD